ncbi:MAG: NTF2 fold immunity protein [Planctomycetota bacterium]
MIMAETDNQNRSPEDDRADPQSVVIGYIAAMFAWENEFARRDQAFWKLPTEQQTDKGLKDIRDCVREEKLKIMLHFCTHKRRVYSDVAASYGSPTVYHPEDSIVEVIPQTKNRTYVIVGCNPRTTIDFKRFCVLKKADGWRIDSVKSKIGNFDWKQGIL